MLRRFKENVITLLTGAGTLERTLHGLSLLDYAMGSAAAVRTSTSRRPSFGVCIQLLVLLDNLDEEWGKPPLSETDNSFRRRLAKPDSPNEIASRLMAVVEETLKPEDLNLLTGSLECLITMEFQKKTLDQYRSLKDDGFSIDSPAEVYVAELVDLWTNLTQNPTPPDISSLPAPSGVDLTQDKTKWPYLGFQSSNPFRDFRATGPLGLRILTAWSRKYNRTAREILHESHTTGTYYPMGSVALNVLSWILEHLHEGELDGFFLLNPNDPFDVLTTIFAYCILEFHRSWKVARPNSIMQFGQVRDKFRRELTPLFQDVVAPERTAHCGSGRHFTPTGILSGMDLQRELDLWVNGHFHTREDSPKFHSKRLAIARQISVVEPV